MTPLILSTAGYILLWIKERRNYPIYVLSCSFVYLAVLTLVTKMDLLLPVFFLALLFPFVLYIRKISTAVFLLLAYEGFYLAYGILFQDRVASIVAFISRDWQFLSFFLAYDILSRRPDSFIGTWNVSGKNVTAAAVIESLLGLYLAYMNYTGTGITRLVASSQPITGNIAIIVLPVLACLYYGVPLEQAAPPKCVGTRVLWYVLVLFLWTVLSGTRGYMIIYAAVFVPLAYSFFFELRDAGLGSRSRVLLFILTLVLLAGIVIFVPSLAEEAMAMLRIKGANASTGIRKYENTAVWGFFMDAPVRVQLFGIGIGGRPGSWPEYLRHLHEQFALGMWNREYYLNRSGAIFHSLYACVLCARGLIGILVLILCYAGIWRRITACTAEYRGLRAALRLYFISFAVMNYYRWSSTCGIAELTVLACILTMIRVRSRRRG